MKIILSRKGFDSAAGRVPSPILPNGEMISLPVPKSDQPLVTYRQLRPRGHNLGDLVDCLSHRTRMGVATLNANDYAHLDPDLDATALKRKIGWRPCFGQDSASLAHLENQRVDKSDLFLFFGLFQLTKRGTDGRVAYDKQAPKVHVLFGWLQIEEVLNAENEKEQKPHWSQSHPHIQGGYGKVYVASKYLELNGKKLDLPGAGVFPRFSKELQLTAAGKLRSEWHLPDWFYPKKGKPVLTYHTDPKRWQRLDNRRVELNTVKRGQEFVLDTNAYPEARNAVRWAKKLIERNRQK